MHELLYEIIGPFAQVASFQVLRQTEMLWKISSLMDFKSQRENGSYTQITLQR